MHVDFFLEYNDLFLNPLANLKLRIAAVNSHKGTCIPFSGREKTHDNNTSRTVSWFRGMFAKTCAGSFPESAPVVSGKCWPVEFCASNTPLHASCGLVGVKICVGGAPGKVTEVKLLIT